MDELCGLIGCHELHFRVPGVLVQKSMVRDCILALPLPCGYTATLLRSLR
jgi:hypothetical protein